LFGRAPCGIVVPTRSYVWGAPQLYFLAEMAAEAFLISSPSLAHAAAAERKKNFLATETHSGIIACRDASLRFAFRPLRSLF
jgi:hypothetical protein